MAMEPSKYAYNVYIFYNSKDKTPSNIGHFINLKRLNVSHEKKIEKQIVCKWSLFSWNTNTCIESKNCHLNSTHSDYVTNFKYYWHIQHMQTLKCQGSDNNVFFFFNDSITDNMHSLAPMKWWILLTSKSKHSSLLVSFPYQFCEDSTRFSPIIIAVYIIYSATVFGGFFF